ncbi:MAG: threonine synthase [Flavobacteriaceae bacterium]|mgnify:CR=1 FL=1|nr:threonine synthase [Flavobacteriaceae bacterium]
MLYKSLNYLSKSESFKEAVIKGIAQDNGLYYPEKIKPFSKKLIRNLNKLSLHNIAFKAIKQFIGNAIPEKKLKTIIEETLNFDFPLIQIEENIFSLELFHGPTLAFKDVGARFMARCLEYFNKNSNEKITVLVATSGDTGGAVADGFYNVSGVEVIILYPKGKVSVIQEKQMTTLGKNIIPLEVEGVFDDCQDMVKRAFLDMQINEKRKLTSANSINIARWLPQMFYYFAGYIKASKFNLPINFSVPSGNFGNLYAGLITQKLGLPINHFLACTNLNNVVPRYLDSGIYMPNDTIKTISNAMDVGNPSNFIRVQKVFNNDIAKLKKNISGYSFNDNETKKCIKNVYNKSNYILDPHGAIGYLGLKEYSITNPNQIGIFMETAHPCKFSNVVEKCINQKLDIPKKLIKTLKGDKYSLKISDYRQLKDYLLKD